MGGRAGIHLRCDPNDADRRMIFSPIRMFTGRHDFVTDEKGR